MRLEYENKQVPDQNKFLVQCIAVGFAPSQHSVIVGAIRAGCERSLPRFRKISSSCSCWLLAQPPGEAALAADLILALHRSQIAAASQPYRRKTYQQEHVDSRLTILTLD